METRSRFITATAELDVNVIYGWSRAIALPWHQEEIGDSVEDRRRWLFSRAVRLRATACADFLRDQISSSAISDPCMHFVCFIMAIDSPHTFLRTTTGICSALIPTTLPLPFVPFPVYKNSAVLPLVLPLIYDIPPRFLVLALKK